MIRKNNKLAQNFKHDKQYHSKSVLGGGSTSKKPTKKTQTQNGYSLVFFGFLWVFLEKGAESTFLNTPDNLRPTYFFPFHMISSGSDTEYF